MPSSQRFDLLVRPSHAGSRNLARFLAYRSAIIAIVLAAAMPDSAQADWGAQGNPVCIEASYDAQVCADGTGGAFIAWSDQRTWSGGHGSLPTEQVYLQHMTGDGIPVPGWPINGLLISGRPTTRLQAKHLTPDGFGGTLVAWTDGETVRLTRVLGNGQIHPHWPDTGLVICSALYRKYNPKVTADGLGGAYVVWSDERNEYNRTDLYVHHISGEGEVVAEWEPNGEAVHLNPGSQWDAWVVSGRDHGVIVAWASYVYGADQDSLHVQHLLANGSIASGWPANGKVLHAGGILDVTLEDDGAGGAVVGWVGSAVRYGPARVRARRISADGTLDQELALTSDGVGNIRTLESATDRIGNVTFTWTDEREVPRVHSGKVQLGWPSRLAPGWPLGGVRVSTREGYQGWGHESRPAAVSDGSFVVMDISTPYDGEYVCAQRLEADGTYSPEWGPEGIALGEALSSGPGHGYAPSIAAVGDGQAIAAWTENSNIYAQLLGLNVPVPTVSLVSALAEPGRVELTWFASEVSELSPVVHRRDTWSEWKPIGSPSFRGHDLLFYQDLEVDQGDYGYRLGYLDGNEVRYTQETWVHVPDALALSLAGLRPNPSTGEFLVAFSLPTTEPAVLEVVAVTGRVVLERRVSSLGRGDHLLHLGDAGIPPGVYWLRLTQGGQTLVTKGVVAR